MMTKGTTGINVPFLFCCSLLFLFPLITQARDQAFALEFGRIGVENKSISTTGNRFTMNRRKIVEFNEQILPQEGMKENDRITKLPGQPNSTCSLEQYGGYVTVNQQAGRALFYYFVEVSDASIKDSAPLVLWLNGGPGCSSIGYGAMDELGPFRVKSDGKTLYENEYAWNKVANVLFLESPVGVGYSYSNTTSDSHTNNDERAAEDSYIFLLNWLERFPEYKNKDFYITGESYAGHYVPQLANLILVQNKLGKNIINLKGVAIGNGNFDDAAEEIGRYKFLADRGFISDSDFDNIRNNCDFNVTIYDRTMECAESIARSVRLIAHGYINIYNIYAPLCPSGAGVTVTPKETSLTDLDPCTDKYVKHYLNLPEVQLALHANVTKLAYPWEECRREVNYLRTREGLGLSMVPILKHLLDSQIRVLLYSGDIDGQIPYTSTKNVMKILNLPEQVPLTGWNASNQIAGESVEYKGGLIFTTIRGAGHEVPLYQPERAFEMIKCFLKNESFPQFNI